MAREFQVQVNRDTEEIVEDLIEHRNQKVESDAEFSTAYTAKVYGTGNPSEDAFYNTHANSSIRMDIGSGTEVGSAINLARAVQETEDAETALEAKVDGIYEHGPVLQRGIEALESAGFENPYVEMDARYRGDSITETIEGIEEREAQVDLYAHADGPKNSERSDQHYMRADYNPGAKSFTECHVCSPSHARDGDVEELETRMEDALDEFGILDKQ